MPSVYLSPSLQEFNRGVGSYGTEEERMNQVADVVENLLKEYGVTVYRNAPSMSLAQAVRDSNSKNPDIHVALHSNASSSGAARGPEVYAYSPSTPGDQLAQLIYDELAALFPTPGLGVKYSPLYETRRVKAPTALAEVGFHDNYADAKFIEENVENIGRAVAKAILRYFGIANTL